MNLHGTFRTGHDCPIRVFYTLSSIILIHHTVAIADQIYTYTLYYCTREQNEYTQIIVPATLGRLVKATEITEDIISFRSPIQIILDKSVTLEGVNTNTVDMLLHHLIITLQLHKQNKMCMSCTYSPLA